MPAPKGNQYAKGNKGGRPTDYRPEYADQLRAYFNQPACVRETVENSKGEMVQVVRPASLPTLAGFACTIGVTRDTLRNWGNAHEEFLSALKEAKEHQERILVENGLMGSYDRTFAIFTAKNLIDWRDKQDVEHTGAGGAPLIPESSPEDVAKRVALILAQGLANT